MAFDARLTWRGGGRFDAEAAANRLVIDGDGEQGQSPMQLLTVAIAGCMAIDVASILEKGRQPLAAMSVRCSAERQATPPKRLTSVTLTFELTGDVSEAAVQRAIQLSRDKYCSVWQSIRQDIDLTTAFDITP